MKFIRSHWPTVLSVLGAIFTFLLPSLQSVAATHPRTTVGLLAAAIVAAYNVTAPKDQKFLGK